MKSLRIGLVVNPLAGLGGGLAFKGSDGETIRSLAADLNPAQLTRSMERVQRALAMLGSAADLIEFVCGPGALGEQVLATCGLSAVVVGEAPEGLSSAEDTRAIVETFRDANVDIVVFAGGDGTARDVFDVVGDTFPVLGIPAGVKMHSGVFAVSPEAAGELIAQLAKGGLVGLTLQEVRDIDEEAFRHDKVKSRFYGEMLVPGEGRYLQHTKVGGRESPELVAADIAAWIAENLRENTNYLIGPGSTTAAIMEEIGLPATLLGVDVIRNGEVIATDADESRLMALLVESGFDAEIIVTVIGGQGHVFGRGNQQISPAVIRAVGLDNITIVAAKSKIGALEERPLLVDTNDPELDRELAGYRPVITGYQDQILYRLATMPESD